MPSKKTFFLIIFFFLIFSINVIYTKEILNIALICKPFPEGVAFGLWLDKNIITQYGIENFNLIVDYEESIKNINSKEIHWLNLTLNLLDFKLNLGNMENYIAECSETNSLEELIFFLNQEIKFEMNKNTI